MCIIVNVRGNKEDIEILDTVLDLISAGTLFPLMFKLHKSLVKQYEDKREKIRQMGMRFIVSLSVDRHVCHHIGIKF